MTPITAYEKDLKVRQFKADPAQANAVLETQALYERLINPPKTEPRKKLLGFLKKQKTKPITGLYFWGGVGRGKSYLIDTFYDCLPFTEKTRVHFNHFMQKIHGQLKTLPKTPDPLIVVANELAKRHRILCIDEFHVDDITDAMIMAGLLDALFSQGVTLVTTSNIEPDLLYKNGLQRDRFLPAIDLIHEHTKIIHLDNGTDYRLALFEQEGTYHVVDSDDQSHSIIDEQLKKLANTQINYDQQISLNNRTLRSSAVCDNQIWFSFAEICQTPRSSADYIALARDYETILVDNIPIMDDGKNDVVQRFIQLIDAIYDHKVKLVATAQAQPHQLYTGERLAFPFQRAASRLVEMRSQRYLSQSHSLK